MKRLLSVLLCMFILISAFGSLTVFADETDPTEAPVEKPEVPQVRIVTNDGVGLSLKKADGYVDATVTIIDTDGKEIGGEAVVKVRGNSTSGPAKKSYTFKFPKKLDVLGMGKAKKWAVLANVFDPTGWRNYIGIHSAAELGLDYTSQQDVVEVWMDGNFRGCYNLIEPVQEGKTRVDIDIESNNGLNDFLVEREYNHYEADAVYFSTNGIRFVCDEPEAPNEEQLAYIQSTMDRVIDVLKNGTRAEIEETIDLPSFAKYCILNEFVKDVDFDYSSVFFYYKGGKLYAGPAWDYDLSMGNEDVAASDNYAASNRTDGLHCDTKHLYQWLYSREWFFDVIRSVYLEHRDYFESIGADGGLLDTLAQTYAGPIERNFSKDGANWHVYAYYPYLNRKADYTYQANLDYLKNWCTERTAWLDGYFTEDISEYMLGDSDTDGEISTLDATVIQRQLADMTTKSYDATAADTDGDSVVTTMDVTYLQRYLAYFNVPAQIGQSLWKK